MAYDLPDPASNMGGNYADAVTRTYSPPPGAPRSSGPTNDQRDWFGNPIRSGAIQFVPGAGYRRNKGKDANGNTIYQDLTGQERTSNSGQYSFAREDAALERTRSERLEAEARARSEKKDAIGAQQQNQQFQLQFGSLQNQIEGTKLQGQQIAGQIAGQTAQLGLQSQQLAANTAARGAELEQSKVVHKDDVDYRNDQIKLQVKTLDDTNRINERKLTLDDQQFQRQAGLDDRRLDVDEKQSRRSQILGALTIMAQSASRF